MKNSKTKEKPQTIEVVENGTKKVNTKLKFVSFIEKPIVLNHKITLPDENPIKFESSKGNLSFDKVYDLLYLELQTSNIVYIHSDGSNKAEELRKKDLKDAGIRTIKQFVEAGISKTSKIMKCSLEVSQKIHYNALSLYQNRIIKLKEARKLTDNPIYLKIQCDAFQSLVFIITIYISETNELIQLIACNKDEELKIVKECLEILNKYKQEDIITYSGTGQAEIRVLYDRFNKAKLKYNDIKFLEIFYEMNESFSFPVEKYCIIYNLAFYFGSKFKYFFKDNLKKMKEEMKDADCIFSQNVFNTKEFKKLRECNKDDLMSLVGIVEYLYS